MNLTELFYGARFESKSDHYWTIQSCKSYSSVTFLENVLVPTIKKHYRGLNSIDLRDCPLAQMLKDRDDV